MWSPHCGGTNLTKSPNIWRHRLSSLQFQIFWALTTYTCPDDHQVKVWELQLKLICELQGGSFRDKSPQFRTNGLPADDDDDSRSWPSHDILNHVQLDKSLVFVDRLAAGTNSWHSLLHLAPPRPIASNQLNSEKCCSPAPANAAGTIFRGVLVGPLHNFCPKCVLLVGKIPRAINWLLIRKHSTPLCYWQSVVEPFHILHLKIVFYIWPYMKHNNSKHRSYL